MEPSQITILESATVWSGRGDSNARPPAPKAGALPGCATPRLAVMTIIAWHVAPPRFFARGAGLFCWKAWVSNGRESQFLLNRLAAAHKPEAGQTER